MSLKVEVFTDWSKKIRDKTNEKEIEKLCEEMTKELAATFTNKVIKRTPVGIIPEDIDDETKEKYWSGYTGGNLRRNWTVGKLERTGGNGTRTYRIKVENQAKYAVYVEEGHRQTVGKYVPQLGKTLKKPWVEGKHMNRITADEIKEIAGKYVEKRLTEFCENLQK